MNICGGALSMLDQELAVKNLRILFWRFFKHDISYILAACQVGGFLP
jgi:hypothetical protein